VTPHTKDTPQLAAALAVEEQEAPCGFSNQALSASFPPLGAAANFLSLTVQLACRLRRSQRAVETCRLGQHLSVSAAVLRRDRSPYT